MAFKLLEQKPEVTQGRAVASRRSEATTSKCETSGQKRETQLIQDVGSNYMPEVGGGGDHFPTSHTCVTRSWQRIY